MNIEFHVVCDKRDYDEPPLFKLKTPDGFEVIHTALWLIQPGVSLPCSGDVTHAPANLGVLWRKTPRNGHSESVFVPICTICAADNFHLGWNTKMVIRKQFDIQRAPQLARATFTHEVSDARLAVENREAAEIVDMEGE